MKRLKFHRALVAIAMMLIGWLPSLAHHFEVEGIFYNVISTTEVEVTYKGSSRNDYNEYNGSVVIPSLVEYGGFTYSVTSIGSGAFEFCESLTGIQIPNSVTSIGEWAFGYCSSLTSIEIPNSVTSIGDASFSGCSCLTSIVVDSGNTKYDSRNDCNAIIETASNTLIAGCQTTVIPNSVTSIGDEAFYVCESLKSIEIPNSVTSIGNSAFYCCYSLTSVVIGNNVTSIGDEAFYECNNLTSVVIGNSVTSIGDSAFSDCDSLTSVVIGNSVTSIGNYAFSGCYGLTSIVVDAGNSKYDSRNGCNAIIETASNTLIVGCQNTIIPNNVTSIGYYAFDECTSLTSIEIPNSVTSIGEGAFCYCKSLTSVEIGNRVTSIGDYAFSNCTSLTSIKIPNSVTSIGSGAFYRCSGLTSIEIPNSVTSIGGSAFYRCSGLTIIICTATTPPTIESDTFSEYSAFLFVPIGCKATYEVADYWKYFNIKEIPIILSTSIALNQTTATLKVTETLTLVATVSPENATNTVEWSSSDETVAIVDENGVVTAIALGEAVITATTIDGSNLSASCKVTVVSSLAQSITLDKTEVSLKATETATLVATVLPETTSNKSVEWKSSNDAVATVNNNGEVTAIAVGEAIITATTTDGTNLSASCKVAVVPTLAETITLDKTEISLEATETATLIATVLPELTTDKSVEWSSSDESVATIDANGLVTAIAVGEATITATTVDDSNLSASCKVTVVPTLAVSIELDQTEASVEEKSELQLTATILPEHATNKEVAWSSSDKWVASVDNTGLVTIYSAGEVIITATTTDGSNFSATCHINIYSGIDGVNGDDVIVASIGENIVVKNATVGSVVRVYTTDGAMIASEVATEGDVIIEAPAKGIYVVTVGKQTVKVII